MILFKNKFMTIHFRKEDIYPFLELIWSEQTRNMSVPEYKSCVEKYLELVLDYRPAQVLIETKLFLFSISPDIQEWIIESITPKTLEAGLSRMALIVTEDFFSQLSIEQTMENPAPNFDVKYFKNRISALEWIQNPNSTNGFH
ncbi:MAG: hypothetical protein H7A24_09835 [Leptospiraceae bacterium]|nr:hypothetical protein [Leptospiraceae bacterium]MCP5512170.1 hypothetical protein [Leptospiraceae bacterium]